MTSMSACSAVVLIKIDSIHFIFEHPTVIAPWFLSYVFFAFFGCKIHVLCKTKSHRCCKCETQTENAGDFQHVRQHLCMEKRVNSFTSWLGGGEPYRFFKDHSNQSTEGRPFSLSCPCKGTLQWVPLEIAYTFGNFLFQDSKMFNYHLHWEQNNEFFCPCPT